LGQIQQELNRKNKLANNQIFKREIKKIIEDPGLDPATISARWSSAISDWINSMPFMLTFASTSKSGIFGIINGVMSPALLVPTPGNSFEIAIGAALPLVSALIMSDTAIVAANAATPPALIVPPTVTFSLTSVSVLSAPAIAGGVDASIDQYAEAYVKDFNIWGMTGTYSLPTLGTWGTLL
jgi:hypothetical protein